MDQILNLSKYSRHLNVTVPLLSIDSAKTDGSFVVLNLSCGAIISVHCLDEDLAEMSLKDIKNKLLSIPVSGRDYKDE